MRLQVACLVSSREFTPCSLSLTSISYLEISRCAGSRDQQVCREQEARARDMLMRLARVALPVYASPSSCPPRTGLLMPQVQRIFGGADGVVDPSAAIYPLGRYCSMNPLSVVK